MLKYLNKGSTHTPATFKSIPAGVINRLAKLTSLTPETEDKRIDELYPGHVEALRRAKLISNTFEFPTLQQANEKLTNNHHLPAETTPESTVRQAKKDRDKARTTWFCIRYSKIWGTPVSKRLRRLQEKHGLKWLRTEMFYHKFLNLEEKFNSDLTSKIMKDIKDYDFKDRPCNCDVRYLKSDQTCWFENNCRKSMVVYELKCKLTGKSYYGKTQQYLKKRTAQHVHDVWKVIETGNKKFGPQWTSSGGYSKADSFVKHFTNLCGDCKTSNAVRAKLKTIMTPSIIWQGDRIRCMKSARTARCKICMVERMEILHQIKTNKAQVINDNSDIFSSCKCGSRFHKFF